MFIQPRDGLSVVDPDLNDELPTAGREVEENQYWYRRLADGDVVQPQPLKNISQSSEIKA